FIETNKKMPFPQLQVKLNNTSMNGLDIEVERDRGNIISVKSGEKIIYESTAFKPGTEKNSTINQQQLKYTSQPARKGNLMNNHVENIHSPAHAPYNFVSLNDKVVEAEKRPDFNSYSGNTGWIEVEIETKTPIYIRGTVAEDEDKSGKEAKDVTKFFSPGGKTRIPGSSLRGMIRNLVEIVTFGKFSFFDDKMLYFRGLADKSNLRKEYQQRMSSQDKNSRKAIYKMSAGVLYKEGFYYFIKPVESYKQILKKEARQKVSQTGKTYKEFNFYKLNEGYLVVSGDMKNKKRDWLISFPKQNVNPIPIPEEDVKNYNNDITRAEKVPNLIKLSAKGEVPCFYVKWRKDRISFGHTGMFRLVYEKTIKEHISGQLQDNNKVDIAESIFGNEKTFAGRVFFEDIFMEENQNNVSMGEKTPKILSSPKPTTFQHYLVQTGDDIRQLNHYNTDASLRGYKLYWHKSGKNWEEKNLAEIDKHKTQYTRINPVREGIKFTGKIRFENLSDVELGALLFSLDLPQECCHKIGMGKPLGLGSVKITPTLFLSDRKKRYESLFTEWDIQECKDINKFKKDFEKYIIEKTEEKKQNLWEVDRLKELKIMLNFQHGVNLELKNNYMEIQSRNGNEFRDRPVLPKPTKI
ncbi:MAG: TIGR03986 family CRISPR-associated RAMP protein, partial [Candidatus Eremiobacterota bacterium]